MKKIVAAVVLAMGCYSAQAQFGVGGQVNWMNYFQGGPTFIGLGANASAVLGDYPIRLSVNVGLPQRESHSVIGNRLDNFTIPETISVTVDERISLLNFWLDVQRYFGSGDYEDGGVYGMLGIGLTLASFTYEVPSFDPNYSIGTGWDSESVSQLGIRAGLGYEAALGFGNLFGEAGLNLSSNQRGDQIVAVNLPSFMFINAGVRRWF